ncbi:hypothetical protein GCM10010207_85450 [Streptomyces atratus]|nr:hypothetical protein GCM10010207_85450 [Streptomyces atratus]
MGLDGRLGQVEAGGGEFGIAQPAGEDAQDGACGVEERHAQQALARADQVDGGGVVHARVTEPGGCLAQFAVGGCGERGLQVLLPADEDVVSGQALGVPPQRGQAAGSGQGTSVSTGAV